MCWLERESLQSMHCIQADMTAAAVAAAPAPQVTLAVGPKFCPGCGAPANGGKFCENCGTRLM